MKIAVLANKYGSIPVRLAGGHAVPNYLCLDQNFDETVTFFHDLRVRTRLLVRGVVRMPTSRKRSRIGWVRSFSDFTTLQHISAGAALVLASEYDRISRRSGFPPATLDVEKWNPYVATTLSRLGFFEMLDLNPYGNEPDDAIIIKQMVSNDQARGIVATEKIKELFDEIGGDKGIRVALSSAVIDAVENVVGHAYPTDWPQRRLLSPLWWFVGAADPRNRTVTLVIYDHGVTIPVSLPRKWSAEHLSSVFLSLFRRPFKPDDPEFDAEAIDTAMKIGTTSTGASYRGRGLAKIRELIERCPAGQLRIVSRHGECIYRSDGTQVRANHTTPLMGTYIELEASFELEGSQDDQLPFHSP